MSELATRTIALNFRRMSKRQVDAMGYATLGVDEPKPNVDPRQFMNAEELKIMKEFDVREDKMREHLAMLQKELDKEKRNVFGRLKSALTGKKHDIARELDRLQDEAAKERVEKANFMAHTTMRYLDEQKMKDMEAAAQAMNSPKPIPAPSP